MEERDIESLKTEMNNKMLKSIDNLNSKISNLHTGRASPNLLEGILVESYGQKTHISHLSTISIQDASTLTVQVWDKSMVKPIEKAIADSNLDLNVIGSNQSQSIKVKVPGLNEERRKKIVKLMHDYCEENRISVRNIRREYIALFKNKEKTHELSEDMRHSIEKSIDNITKDFISQIDKIMSLKEKEIMTI